MRGLKECAKVMLVVGVLVGSHGSSPCLCVCMWALAAASITRGCVSWQVC